MHHWQLISEGGSDDPDNLVDLCKAHHDRFHEGLLRIEGTRDTGLQFLHADGTPIGQAPSPGLVLVAKDAYDALRAWQFSDAEARRAVRAVLARDGELPLQAFVKAALRECRPVPGDGSGKVSEKETSYLDQVSGDAAPNVPHGTASPNYRRAVRRHVLAQAAMAPARSSRR